MTSQLFSQSCLMLVATNDEQISVRLANLQEPTSVSERRAIEIRDEINAFSIPVKLSELELQPTSGRRTNCAAMLLSYDIEFVRPRL